MKKIEKTRAHFAFRVDTWTPDGNAIVEHVARRRDYTLAMRTARSWRRIIAFTHPRTGGRMTVTIGRRELLAALGGAAAAPLVGRDQHLAH